MYAGTESIRPIPAITAKQLRRVCRKLSIPGMADGCWLWVGSRNRKGYGEVRVGGVSYRPHRLMYSVHHGDPGKLVIDHLCRNPSCVNPDHLEAVDQKTNIERGNSHLREKKTRCLRGHAYDEANTYIAARGTRSCRACHRERAREEAFARQGRNRVQNQQKTHCNSGHPLSGENLRIDTYGRRRCVTCIREKGRAYYHRKRKERAQA